MRTLIWILILAALSSSLVEAQAARHSRQQATATDHTKLEAQRNYDPLAGQKHLQDGPLDRFLDSINPRDRDFGALIADARERLVEQTAKNSYFWIILGESLTILLLVGYIFWLFRQRNDRLEISVNLVTQLANSYLYTRSRAIDAITRHNRLVDEYNALAERNAKQQSGQQAVFDSVIQGSARKRQVEAPAQTTAPTLEPEPATEPIPAEPKSTGTASEVGEPMTKEQLKTLLEQTKRNATRGAAQQIGALTQQVHNLRERLNMALTQIEKFEKHNRNGVGA
jgi:hypothetical protein